MYGSLFHDPFPPCFLRTTSHRSQHLATTRHRQRPGRPPFPRLARKGREVDPHGTMVLSGCSWILRRDSFLAFDLECVRMAGTLDWNARTTYRVCQRAWRFGHGLGIEVEVLTHWKTLFLYQEGLSTSMIVKGRMYFHFLNPQNVSVDSLKWQSTWP